MYRWRDKTKEMVSQSMKIMMAMTISPVALGHRRKRVGESPSSFFFLDIPLVGKGFSSYFWVAMGVESIVMF